ncbi:HNH endonuclease family protein [Deinococcus marmoris]|uniref:HNH endonuclease family protein n=1 Tax=Deinococcus marmoris TaxID=249408 RepID=UPI0009DE5BD7|nr:DUF262 domain-containing protein [Deinococcus marmoris]
MTNKVFLDALIPREDFDVENEASSSGLGRSKDTASVSDLKFGDFFVSVLRKPDFQRETNEWDVGKAYSLITSFLDGDLIPAISLWKNKSNIFIIDGAHRLSALIAWVNNDYGDGEGSSNFFEGNIPEEIRRAAQKARLEIDEKIGSYASLKAALSNPGQSHPDTKRLERARALGHLAVQLQWVEGDSSKAESSFFTINQQGTPISDAEIELLRSRRRPISISARAILRGGRGHKYWQNLDTQNQSRITDVSSNIHNLLFKPDYATPIRTLDLPVGGKTNNPQILSLVYQAVKIINSEATDIDKDDNTGEKTHIVLNRTEKVIKRITGNSPRSLGLHPAVYFYSKRGAFKTASFWAVILLIKDMEERKLLTKFTGIREEFERFLLEFDGLDQQIVRKRRTALAAYQDIKLVYETIIDNFIRSKSYESLPSLVKSLPNFDYLSFESRTQKVGQPTEFNKDTKNEIFMRQALVTARKCPICGGLLHVNSISFDHLIRKQDGGNSSADNGQATHPYCNTSVKK